MKRSLIATALLVGLTLAGTAAASDLSYTYVEAGYAHTSSDEAIDLDGFGVNGSFDLGANFHAIGSLSVAEGDEYDVDQEVTTWSLGLGYAYPISQTTSLDIRASYESGDNDLKVADFEGLGRLSGTIETQSTVAELGLRHSFSPRFEGFVYGGYIKIDDFEVTDVRLDGENLGVDVDLTTELVDDDSTYGRIGGLFKFNETWGVGGQVTLNKDFTTYTVGARASF